MERVLLCNEEYMQNTSTNTNRTPYLTVVCEEVEYIRVQTEYINDTLEYDVLCTVRTVQGRMAPQTT